MSDFHSTREIARILRHRARELIAHGVYARIILEAADELERLDECSSDGDHGGDLRSYMDVRLSTHAAEVKEIIMALQADVQALIDQVAANTSAEASAIAAMAVLSEQVVALNTQITDLIAQLANGAPIDAEDLAAIQGAVTNLRTSLDALSAAIPANVPQPPAGAPGDSPAA